MASKTLQNRLAKLDVETAAIATLNKAVVLPLLQHQREVFGSRDDPRPGNLVCVGGRRVGKTWGAAGRLIELCFERPGLRALWVDVGYKSIQKYQQRIFRPWLARYAQGTYTLNLSNQTIAFRNGSSIDFGSQDNPESLLGQGYDVVVVNEAGVLLASESLWFSVLLPMLAEGAGGIAWIVGTAKRPRGLHRTLYERGLDPAEPDWRSWSHPSTVNPKLNPDLLARWSRDMPSATYAMEVEGRFPDDGTGFFRNVRAVVQGEPERPAPGAVYCIGIDLARKADFTVAWVSRMDQRRAVWCERWSRMDWPEQVRRLAELAGRYHGARLIVDATGLGDVVLADLRLAGARAEGFIFTQSTKAEVLNYLSADIEQGRLSMCVHEPTIRELEAFERKDNGKLEAPSGGHDDTVMALALANYGMGRPARDMSGMFETTPSMLAAFHHETWRYQ